MKVRVACALGACLVGGVSVWLACGERITGENEELQGKREVTTGLHALPNGEGTREGVPMCCNWFFPTPRNTSPGGAASMKCGDDEYIIDCNTCARYWSAYVPIGGHNPQEMCEYLPGDPPLPPVPVPGDFAVSVVHRHPVLTWAPYHVHGYWVERKIGAGSWRCVATITSFEQDTWTDESVEIPDAKDRPIYYRMRGSIFGVFSEYTVERQALPQEEKLLP